MLASLRFRFTAAQFIIYGGYFAVRCFSFHATTENKKMFTLNIEDSRLRSELRFI